MKYRICFIALLFLIFSTLNSLSAQSLQLFRFFELRGYEQTDEGAFIKAVYKGSRVEIRSFEEINSTLIHTLEQYVVDVLFADMSGEDYSIEIASIEILVSNRGSIINVETGDYLIRINDVLAIQAGELFQNKFSITFGKNLDKPVTKFPDMICECGLFKEEDQELLLQTGFLGWFEISRQIRLWIQDGYERRDEEVLSFVNSHRILLDVDSVKNWEEIFILPPRKDISYVSGFLIEISGANLMKYFGNILTIGFGSLTGDFMFTWQPERVPDLSNFRVFDAGLSAGLFLEFDPTLSLSSGFIDKVGLGPAVGGNVLFYLPGFSESRIDRDVFALGAELLIRTNLIPFMDSSDFFNDNDYLFHISPRFLMRLPVTKTYGAELAIGLPSLRILAGGESSFFDVLSIGLDLGLRGYYCFAPQ